jgi:hypothetical protein
MMWNCQHTYLTFLLFSFFSDIAFCQYTNRFCDVQPDPNYPGSYTCNTSDYVTSLVLATLPAIILAFAALVFCAGFSVGYMMCAKCGCPKPPRPNPKWKLGLRITLIVATCILLVGFILMLVGNTRVSNAVNEFGTITVAVAVNVSAAFNNLDALVASLPTFTPIDLSTEIMVAKQGAADVEQETRQSQDAFNAYNQFRESFVFVTVVIPLVFMALGIAASWLNWRFVVLALVVITSTWLILVWITFAVHVICIEAVTDICNEYNTVTYPYSTPAQYNSALYALSRIVACNTSDFGDLQTALENVLNNTLALGCQSIDQLCMLPDVIQSSPSVGDCTTQGPCSISLLQDYATGPRGAQTFYDVLYECKVGGNMTVVNNPQQCDIPSSFNVSRDVQMPLPQCPSSCANSLLRLDTENILVVANATLVFQNILQTQIFPLLDCYFVVQAFQATETIVCQDFPQGLQLVAAGAVIYAFTFMAAIAVFILGWKQFAKV